MPPRTGQSSVLFDDGYAEGWAKCLDLCKAVAPSPIPVVEAGADAWYLQDSRDYVGNDVLWWAASGGYTTDLSKAEVFTKNSAFRQASMRDTDKPWPKAYIDRKARPAVDMQYISQQEVNEEAPK